MAASVDMYLTLHTSTIPLLLQIGGSHILGWILVMPSNWTSETRSSIYMVKCNEETYSFVNMNAPLSAAVYFIIGHEIGKYSIYGGRSCL